MPILRAFTTQSANVFRNLALEELLFQRLDFANDTQGVFLWRNDPCVVLGRHQSPWMECNLRALTERKIALARRFSGGGTVYHDQNNMCITFLSPHPKGFARERNQEIIINALASLGIASFGGPDRTAALYVSTDSGQRKISGSAFRIVAHRAYHHCTLLLDTELSTLRELLRVPPRDIVESRSTTSNPHPVCNLRTVHPTVSFEAVAEALLEAFARHYGCKKPELEQIKPHEFEAEESYAACYDKITKPEWIYGETPRFTQRLSKEFEWGSISALLTVEHGRIAALEPTLECSPAGIEICSIIRPCLVGTNFSCEDITSALRLERRVLELPQLAYRVGTTRAWIASCV
eukprot:TRINITY_DN83752_c0_g1_i1.p1 TRINITY_DN83752_c0_g1~~TRINITY_DN83752_c0_g1_i1.p1  ORF type:complete len:356 (+),score=26.89 TRINITY_DN83752_c0_g1_i1:24-1070(+)